MKTTFPYFTTAHNNCSLLIPFKLQIKRYSFQANCIKLVTFCRRTRATACSAFARMPWLPTRCRASPAVRTIAHRWFFRICSMRLVTEVTGLCCKLLQRQAGRGPKSRWQVAGGTPLRHELWEFLNRSKRDLNFETESHNCSQPTK